MNSPNFIIFTDLDGTLLDQQTYEFKEAKPALEELKRQNIPLILTSSKTSAEIQKIRQQLRNKDPFIVENGGAIYIPQGYLNTKFKFDKIKDDHYIIELGTPYAILRQKFNKLKEAAGLPIAGFGDLTTEELTIETGLSLEDANLARHREYDEPFFVKARLGDKELKHLKKLVKNYALTMTTGGNFFHLMGNIDKGKAVKILISLFNKELGKNIVTIGLGDSLNDLPLLEAVNLPILIQKPSGEYDREVSAKINATLAEGVGPRGWNNVILKIISV